MRQIGLEPESIRIFETLQRLFPALQSDDEVSIPLQLIEEIEERKQVFDTTISKSYEFDFSVCFFHVPAKKGSSVISTFDLKAWDLSGVDFEKLLLLTLKLCKWSNPRARLVLITDNHFFSNHQLPWLEVIRLNIDASQLMFERVKCMLSGVLSSLANRPIVYLDSDALVAAPLPMHLLSNTDILLTHRQDLLMVPINEGVIYVNSARQIYTRKFFWRYLASYLRLFRDERVKKIYPDIRLWRGGQLALNSIVGGMPRYRDGVHCVGGVNVGLYPTSRMNLSVRSTKYISSSLWDQSPIVHLKGAAKIASKQFEMVLRERGFYDVINP